MGDRNDHMFAKPMSRLPIFGKGEYAVHEEAQRALDVEKRAAERQAILAEAYRQMPPDLRQQAETWGVKALMEAVWMNGWDCGYRQSIRDASAVSNLPPPAERDAPVDNPCGDRG